MMLQWGCWLHYALISLMSCNQIQYRLTPSYDKPDGARNPLAHVTYTDVKCCVSTSTDCRKKKHETQLFFTNARQKNKLFDFRRKKNRGSRINRSNLRCLNEDPYNLRSIVRYKLTAVTLSAKYLLVALHQRWISCKLVTTIKRAFVLSV